MTSDSGAQRVVVVGVDGSAESVAALGWARDYAEATGATVRAVLAWHYPPAAGRPPVGGDDLGEEARQRIARHLAETVAAVYPAPAVVQTRVRFGHPAEVLIEESNDASLLVIGHRGHGAFTGMLVGSVSIHCVQHANCSVVVVRG